jgi:hypothetical protein
MPARRTVLPFPSESHATPNWGAKFKVIFRIEKEPVWRAVYHASRVRVPNRGAVTSGNETTAEIRHIIATFNLARATLLVAESRYAARSPS